MLGAPPVGRGRTLGMAIGDWLIQNQSRLGISFELTAAAQPSEATRSRQDRAGLIEETLKAIGVDVDFEDPEEMAAERNSTMGWLDPLEAYKPKVTLIERQARS